MKKITFLLSLILSTMTYGQIVTNGNFQTGTAAPWYGNAANVVDQGGGSFVNEANVTAVGLEYAFKETVMLRGGYAYQENILDANDYYTQYVGFAGGAGFILPISKSGTRVAIDYSYAPTRVFNGIHNLSITLSIDNKK